MDNFVVRFKVKDVEQVQETSLLSHSNWPQSKSGFLLPREFQVAPSDEEIRQIVSGMFLLHSLSRPLSCNEKQEQPGAILLACNLGKIDASLDFAHHENFLTEEQLLLRFVERYVISHPWLEVATYICYYSLSSFCDDYKADIRFLSYLTAYRDELIFLMVRPLMNTVSSVTA